MCPLLPEWEFDLAAAASSARSARESFPHARLRVTPAMHEKLAYRVCAGTDMDPLGIIVRSYQGLTVEVDPDVEDWQIDTWA